MTANHDHASLFLAADGAAGDAAGEPGPAPDGGAEAMRQLLDPFAVQPAPTAEDSATSN
ncbi:hypothetical protein SAMN05421812_101528 [Asanoa hainanensis]|uniref:Uncharacterized protein n=1 Tax=Asanoa hainanensis TaxID=560556 RepID=A0A239GUB2_9ACTN|nr:hypothetical protein [Asanoa hainanensis]SNS71654.1 hypothetical protein SAMN05421812_101528 [Asanoa hainanensis]